MKRFRIIFLIAATILRESWAESVPGFDPKNAQAIAARTADIVAKYKGDPARMNVELEKLNRQVAHALGHGDDYDRAEALQKKYGIPLAASLSADPAHPYDLTDTTAWRHSIGRVGDDYRVEFFLDRTRYHDAKPQKLEVRIETSGGEGTAQKPTVLKTLKVAGKPLVYAVTLPDLTPETDHAVLVLDALIEPGWKAVDRLPLSDVRRGIRDAAIYDANDVCVQPVATTKMPAKATTPAPKGSLRVAVASFVIGEDGKVESAQVLTWSSESDRLAASQAIETWRFTPAKVDGKPVRCRIQEAVPFEE